MNKMTEIKLADVVFRTDLYPRIKPSPETVQKYAEDLDVLPPIEVNQRNELIDGWHRWTAHKKAERSTIKVLVTETRSDVELLELAIDRNSKFGLQLSMDDKCDMARKLYHQTNERDRDGRKAQLAKLLSVSERTVRGWLSRIDKDSKAARDRRILDMWMQCYTQEEIAGREGVDHKTVTHVLGEMAALPKLPESPAAVYRDYDEPGARPLYNVWKWQEKDSGQSGHFGNSDQRIVDRLLYLYTEPMSVVVDPFAGGGSTLDVCRRRWRRCWVSDRKPIVEREHEIRRHDLTDGLPSVPKQTWKDVRLVYLDPPYWKQAEGEYSNDPTDLGNVDLDAFHGMLHGAIASFAKKLHGGAKIAMILQPTQWRSPGRGYTDHVAEMIRRVGLPIAMRIQAPYESQQCTAQMVEWAKEHRQILVLSREIVVWGIE